MPSTPQDQSVGILTGIQNLISETKVPPAGGKPALFTHKNGTPYPERGRRGPETS